MEDGGRHTLTACRAMGRATEQIKATMLSTRASVLLAPLPRPVPPVLPRFTSPGYGVFSRSRVTAWAECRYCCRGLMDAAVPGGPGVGSIWGDPTARFARVTLGSGGAGFEMTCPAASRLWIGVEWEPSCMPEPPNPPPRCLGGPLDALRWLGGAEHRLSSSCGMLVSR